MNIYLSGPATYIKTNEEMLIQVMNIKMISTE